MKAIIIGAGMGGLSAAIALKQCGYDVEVYEQVKEMKPVGAAISVWSNGVKCLNYLGLEKQIAELGGNMANMAYIDGLTGNIMTQFSLTPLILEAGQKPYPVSRAELQHMLLHAFGEKHVHMGMKLTQIIRNDDQVTIQFEDGSQITGDLLIGADGTHSLIREYVTGEITERRYAGYVNWNGLVAIDEHIAPANQWTTFVGEGKRVSLMPVANNRFYFFFDVPLPKGLANDKTAYKATLHDYFKGWTSQVHDLIDRIDIDKTNRVEIHDIEPFMQWTKGRIALLGDAAHSTTPDIGQGGCAAMEDAIVLAMALKSNTISVEDSLRRYQNRRNQRTAELVLRARKRCDVTHGKDMTITQRWYDELRQDDGTNIVQGIVKNMIDNPLG